MHHLVDETHLQRALRADVPAGENHVERRLQPDPARQPLRAAHARDEAELHFRKRERRLRMVGADAVAAGERHLEPAAEAGAVNRGDDGNAQLSRRSSRAWPVRLIAPHRRPTDLEELFDVGAGDEAVGFAGDQHEPLNERVVLDSPECVFEFAARLDAQRVDRLSPGGRS